MLNLTSSEGRLEVAVSANGILLCGANAAVAQLRWVDRTGKPLADLGEPSPAIYMFRLSPDDRHIAVQIGSAESSDLWLLDAHRGVPSRFTADPGHSTQALWSPDGRTILFTHLGTDDLLHKPSNRGEEEVIINRPNSVIPSDWSSDGRRLLTRESDPQTKYDIWRIPVTPDGRLRQDEPPAPYLRTCFNESQAHFSPGPSPRRVAYSSDESGQSEVYIDSFPEPRGKKRVSREAELHSGVQAAASCTTSQRITN
jgi:Tol biopolymer transport system component